MYYVLFIWGYNIYVIPCLYICLGTVVCITRLTLTAVKSNLNHTFIHLVNNLTPISYTKYV